MRRTVLMLATAATVVVMAIPSASAAPISAGLTIKPETSLAESVHYYRRDYDDYPRYRTYSHYPRYRYYRSYDYDSYYPRRHYYNQYYYHPYRQHHHYYRRYWY